MDFSEFLTDVLSEAPKTHTLNGKEVSHFTMSCYFKSGVQRRWLYRGDHTAKKFKAANLLVNNELEALLLKYNTIKDNIKSCRIYNNKNNRLSQLIFDQCSDGRININKIAEELGKLKNEN